MKFRHFSLASFCDFAVVKKVGDINKKHLHIICFTYMYI